MKINKKDAVIINQKEKEIRKNDEHLFQFDKIEPEIKQYARRKSSTSSKLNTEYDYPVNIFKKFFFFMDQKSAKSCKYKSSIRIIAFR